MSTLRITFKTLVYTLVTLLFLFALCLQGVRTALFFVDKYHTHIERFLSERLTADVSLSNINANWYGLRPTIELHDLEVVSRIDGSRVSASHALIVFDLSDTLLQFSPVFKHVSFTDLALSVFQNENGAWSDSGFFASNANKIGSWRYRSPADLFNTVKFAELENTQLRLQFYDGRVLDTVFPYSDITNEGDNHYLNISASVDDDKDVFSIRVEGVGRPSKPDEFRAKALVELKKFPAGRMAQLLVDQSLTINELNDTTLDAQLWFDFDTTRLFSLGGDFAFSGTEKTAESTITDASTNTSTNASKLFQFKTVADIFQIPLRATITADYQFNQGLDIALQDIFIDNQLELEPVKLVFADDNLSVTTEKIKLDTWSNWAKARFADSPTKDVITGLSITGELDHVVLQGMVGKIDDFIFQAYGKDLGIDSYRDVPRFENVSGFIETNYQKGSIILDSRDAIVASQPFFNEPFVTKAVTGEILWDVSPEENNINFRGNGLTAEADFGTANAYFDLDLPLRSDNSKGHMLLQLGLKNSTAQYSSLFLPTTLPIEFTDWVSTAVQQAELESVGVLYRGPLSEEGERSVQVFLDVNNGAMIYQPDWPVLNNIATQIVFDDTQAIAEIYQASTYDDTMQGTIGWNTQSQNRLSIQADVDTSAESALRFVKNSPLKLEADEAVLNWQVEGDLGINADLLFSLDEDSDFSSQFIEFNLADNRLYLPEQNLDFTEANGTVFFSSENGFSSNDLNGVLFDEKTLLAIKTQENGDLLLSGSGGVGVNALANWLEQPLMSAVGKGGLSYTFDFLMPVEPIDDLNEVSPATPVQTLSLYSDLKGVEIDLPAPFGKSFADATELLLNGSFVGDNATFTIQVEDILFSEVEFFGEEKFKAMVSASDQPVFSVPESFLVEHEDKDEGLFIHGDFSDLNVEPWLPFFDTLETVSDDSAETFPVFYTLQAQSLQMMDLLIQNTSVTGFNNSDVWENTIASDIVAGNIFLRETDSLPLTISLDYLLLPKQEEAVETEDALLSELSDAVEPDPLADVLFEDIYSADVNIKYLEYDGKPLGNWSFVIESNPDVIIVKSIEASIAELSLTGVMQGEGASLRWSRGDEGEQTRFVGRVNGGSLKDVFERWDLPPAVTNERLFGAINLQWPGSPLANKIENLNGDIDFLLEDGIFTQTGGSTTGILKVLSFLNFDTWVKRLRLDFSGILDDGMSFDNVSGRLNFDEGIIQLAEPVEVNSSSLSLSLAGSVDYPNDEIDGDLAVVLPVGGNLNFAAALAAGLPAAVSIYLVRKIFKDAISEVSTVNYRVTGSLANPVIKFDNGVEP